MRGRRPSNVDEAAFSSGKYRSAYGALTVHLKLTYHVIKIDLCKGALVLPKAGFGRRWEIQLESLILAQNERWRQA